MKVTRCKFNHFYDAEKFASCPHCSPDMQSATIPEKIGRSNRRNKVITENVAEVHQDNTNFQMPDDNKTVGMFDQTVENDQIVPADENVAQQLEVNPALGEQEIDPAMTNEEQYADDANYYDDNAYQAEGQYEEENLQKLDELQPTEAAWMEDIPVNPAFAQDVPLQEEQSNETMEEIPAAEEMEQQPYAQEEEELQGESYWPAPEIEAEVEVQPEPTYEAPKTAPAAANSLQQAVKKSQSADPFEQTRTMAIYSDTDIDPVVGWLISLDGEYKGTGFSLKGGRNYIGRSMTMDIALVKERTVSRDKHAILTYEPKKREFYLQPGEGSGLVYVNDDVLMTPVKLSDHDIVQLGNCKFLFKALCGAQFTWDDYR